MDIALSITMSAYPQNQIVMPHAGVSRFGAYDAATFLTHIKADLRR